VDESTDRLLGLVAHEAQVKVAVLLASQGEIPDLLPCVALSIIPGAVTNALPLFEKTLHLQVIEDSLAKGIDAAQEWEGAIVAGRDYSMEQNPLTAFSEIIFKLDHNRHGTPKP
jgi:hypothetical protein